MNNDQAITEKLTNKAKKFAKKSGFIVRRSVEAPVAEDCFGVLVDGLSGRVHRLSQSVLIGRSKACDIIVDAPYISRVHAVLYTNNGKTFIADAGSKNGIAINGKRIVGVTEVNDGDEIHLGLLSLIFTASVDKKEVEAPKAASWIARAMQMPAALLAR